MSDGCQHGECFDLFLGLGGGNAQVVGGLEVDPELRPGSKILSETQSRVRADCPTPSHDRIDPRGRHADLHCQAVLTDSHRD